MLINFTPIAIGIVDIVKGCFVASSDHRQAAHYSFTLRRGHTRHPESFRALHPRAVRIAGHGDEQCLDPSRVYGQQLIHVPHPLDTTPSRQQIKRALSIAIFKATTSLHAHMTVSRSKLYILTDTSVLLAARGALCDPAGVL